jgi:hypothetical protein
LDFVISERSSSEESFEDQQRLFRLQAMIIEISLATLMFHALTNSKFTE